MAKEILPSSTPQFGTAPGHSFVRELSPATNWLYYTEMEIREAMTEDAPAACEVLRRSISELCVADHRNDPAI
jgi:hypothetical protein